MILVTQIKDPTDDDTQLVVLETKVDVTNYMAKMDHRLREECEHKTIFTNLKDLWNQSKKILTALTKKYLVLQYKLVLQSHLEATSTSNTT